MMYAYIIVDRLDAPWEGSVGLEVRHDLSKAFFPRSVAVKRWIVTEFARKASY